MRGPVEVHQELLAAEVAHEIAHLPRTVSSADELPEVLDLPAAACVAAAVYRLLDPARGWAVALVGAGTRADEVRLAAALGAPVSPARAEEASALTGYPAGLVCPVGLPPGIRVVAEGGLLAGDVVYLPAGDPGTVLGLHVEALLALTGAVVADLAAAPVAPALLAR